MAEGIMIELSVIAPCFNEAKSLPELTERVLKLFAKKKIAGELILVNDGSRDNTGEVIDALCAPNENVVGIHHAQNSGIEAAWRSGLERAAGRYICLIDADLQYLPEDISRLFREIRLTNADMVQGYRSSIGRLKDSRYTLSRGLNFLLNTLFDMKQKDNKSGFVLAYKDVIQDVLRHRYKYYYFQTFIVVSAKTKGYLIREVETLFESRLLGESFMSRFPLRVVFLCLLDLLKAFVEFRLRPKRENIFSEFLRQNPPARKPEKLPLLRRIWLEIYFLTMSLHAWVLSRNVRLYYHELIQSQWLPPEDVKRLQEKKLRRLIHHAYRHVGYYRQKFDELGLRPENIQSIDDLVRLPLLDKNDVRENMYFDLLSDNHKKKKILRVSTSGSTGEPFSYFADQHQLELRWASTQRSLEWTGYRFGDKCARLWHQTVGMSRSQIIRERLDSWMMRRLFIPAFEMSDQNIQRLVSKLKSYKPVLIDGYAESFNFLAKYIQDFHWAGFKPKGIVSSAQILPRHSRNVIEDAFGCRVFDKYGSREFSGIAYECEHHDGHHVVAESYIVEILKDGRPARPGEVGEVIITDLNNYCLPLIRYRIGDLAVAMENQETCPCGRGLPRIGDIEGRVQAVIIGSNGIYMPGTFFAHLFKDYDYIIKQYQIFQETPGEIYLRIIKAPRFDEETFQGVLKILKQHLGAETKIEIGYVDHLPMVRTGKHQGTVSALNLDYQKLRAAGVKNGDYLGLENTDIDKN